jgi:6-pyruvoyltetrahydropterin/6-carboxytetrahydropterin synthase
LEFVKVLDIGLQSVAMNIARIRHEIEFCAAFRLEMPGATDTENRAAFGVCFSPNFHGHNYRLAVSVEGPIDARSGMVMDYANLADLIQTRIFAQVDHRNLNLDVGFLQGVIPTSENLAVAFWHELASGLPAGVSLVEIELQESRDNTVIFHGPQS